MKRNILTTLVLVGLVVSLPFLLGWTNEGALPETQDEVGTEGVIIPERTVVIPEVPQPLPPSAQDNVVYDASRNMLVLEPMTKPQVAPDVIGIVRPVDWNGQRFGVWSQRPDGSYLYHVSLQSPGATGIRLHLEQVSLPEGAVLFVYGRQGGQYAGIEGPFTRRGLWDSGEFWTGTVPGDTAIVEYYDPQANGTELPPFSITELGHQWPLPDGGIELLPCQPDVNCDAQAQGRRNAVGYGSYVQGGNIILFTGTLLNDCQGGDIPWFLTAHHAVPSQAVAQSIEVR